MKAPRKRSSPPLPPYYLYRRSILNYGGGTLIDVSDVRTRRLVGKVFLTSLVTPLPYTTTTFCYSRVEGVVEANKVINLQLKPIGRVESS